MLFIDKDTNANIHSKFLTFIGCAFESYYFNEYPNLFPQVLIELSNKLHWVFNRGDRLVFKWIHINADYTAIFCVFF